MAHAPSVLFNQLNSCSSLHTLKKIHALAVTTAHYLNPLIIIKILSLYTTTTFSDLNCAQLIFNHIANPKTHIWNCMIRASTCSKSPLTTLSLYTQMLLSGNLPDNYTFPFILKSCSRSQALNHGTSIHVHVIRRGFVEDPFVQSCLINMYVRCDRIACAHQVFDQIPVRSVVVWTTMISGYVQMGGFEQAIQLFKEMVSENAKPDEVTLASVLTACANLGDLELGRWVHSLMGKKDMVLGTALVDMYAKCKSIDLARQLFDKMPQKDVVSWTAMVAGYVRHDLFREALELFREMCVEHLKPDEAILVNLITGCARSGDLDIGKWIHHYVELEGFGYGIMIGTALIDMYARCGEIKVACQVFKRMHKRNVCSWNAMIGGFAMHGEANKALDLFEEMQGCGVNPDEVTFIGILTACNHAGLVDKGWHNFNSMSQVHSIEPKLEHYACMVDLLGRLGFLQDAEKLLKSMPMKPDAVVWGALLNASRVHGNVELAERAAGLLLELEPRNHGVYVLLSNAYGVAKRWGDVDEVRKLMKLRGIKKTRGCSSIKVNGVVHEFGVGDKSHVRAKEIYENLNTTVKMLGVIGYVAKTSSILFDIDEEEKENELSHHSEKLAISFGLISTRPKATLNILKNLRICEDCHCFAKLVSKGFSRKLVIRDLYRFHHFEEGSCTCGDHW